MAYQNVVLPKIWGWVILAGLIIFDAYLDVKYAGGSGLQSGIWKQIANFAGISNPLLMVPFVLVIFYIGVRIVALLARKIDNVKVKAEELALTTFTLVYFVFDLWLVLFYMFDFRIIRSQYYLIPALIIIGTIYCWWAESKLKKLRQ